MILKRDTINRLKKVPYLRPIILSGRLLFRKRIRHVIPARNPDTIMIEVTNHCNLRCKMCASHTAKRKKGFMDLELYRKILVDAREMAISRVSLHLFGEPLMHPRFVDMVAEAKAAGFNVAMSTNGLLLTESLARELLQAGLDSIRYSIEGATKGTYEDLRRGGNFEKLLENMKIFKVLRDRLGDGYRPGIYVNSLIMRETEAEIGTFLKRYLSFVDTIDFSFLCNQAGNVEEAISNSSLDYIKPKKVKGPCGQLWCAVNVTWDGKVIGCCADAEGELTIGDVSRESLQMIWNNDFFNHHRNLHLRGQLDKIPLCRVCKKITVNPYWRAFYIERLKRKYS